MSGPIILYVPGIKPKPPAAEHRAALWRCLLEGVRRVDVAVAADMARHPDSFQVVSWAHVFYETQRDIGLDAPGIERLLARSGPEERDLREARAFGRRLKQALYRLSDTFPPLFGLLATPDMRATLEDTRRYFANEGGAAVKVRHMVADALIEAWHTGHRVLLIDTDTQANVGVSLGINSHKKTLSDVLSRKAGAEECIVSARKNLDVLSSDTNLFKAQQRMVLEMAREEIFDELFSGLTDYDYQILDCAPSVTLLTVNALPQS